MTYRQALHKHSSFSEENSRLFSDPPMEQGQRIPRPSLEMFPIPLAARLIPYYIDL